MKKNLWITGILLTGMVLLFPACEKVELEAGIPSCIKSKIQEMDPVTVWEWKIEGEIFYYIKADCCDQFNLLYDKQCKLICAPDGGLAGTGDGNCPEFKGEIEKTLVWEKE